MKRSPIVVTRTGDAGTALARALADSGEEVLWLPAFEIGPAPNMGRVTDALSRLAGYDLAAFVSPAAVQATAPLLAGDWPKDTAIGVVGEATRRATLASFPGASKATLFAPDATDMEGEGGGSEPLWVVLQPVVASMRRALILRADHGREWLAEQLAAAGVEVETLAVYTRRVASVSPDAAKCLRGWQGANRMPVLVIASSEAVGAILDLLEPVVGLDWARSARALASHERIAARLRAVGFADVKLVTLDVDSIRRAALPQ